MTRFAYNMSDCAPALDHCPMDLYFNQLQRARLGSSPGPEKKHWPTPDDAKQFVDWTCCMNNIVTELRVHLANWGEQRPYGKRRTGSSQVQCASRDRKTKQLQNYLRSMNKLFTNHFTIQLTNHFTLQTLKLTNLFTMNKDGDSVAASFWRQ